MNHDVTDFQTQVIDRSQRVPVLVDYWAPWCGPCRMLAPVLEKLEAEAGGRWMLAKVNTDEHPDLAARAGVRGIPDVRLYHKGAEIARFSGAMPEHMVRQWLEEHLPTPKREAITAARQHLHAGRSAEALRLLAPLARANPDDLELATLTARAQVFSDPAGALARLEALPPSHPWEENELIVREFARLLTRAEGAPSDDPLAATYTEAARALRAEDFETAAQKLIDVLLENPGYDEGHARAACLALFKHLGMRHPVSEKFSRSFSMAVNV